MTMMWSLVGGAATLWLMMTMMSSSSVCDASSSSSSLMMRKAATSALTHLAAKSSATTMSSLSQHRTLQTTDDRLAMCEESATSTMENALPEDGTVCTCETGDADTIVLLCVDTLCSYCNADGTVCADTADGQVWTADGNGTASYELASYGGDRTETILLLLYSDDGSCVTNVDDVPCNSCSIDFCNGTDSVGITIDCSNIADGEAVSTCGDVPTGGLLQAFGSDYQTCLPASSTSAGSTTTTTPPAVDGSETTTPPAVDGSETTTTPPVDDSETTDTTTAPTATPAAGASPTATGTFATPPTAASGGTSMSLIASNHFFGVAAMLAMSMVAACL